MVPFLLTPGCERSLYEGFKVGMQRGLPLSIRQTDPTAIRFAIQAHEILFAELVAHTLTRYHSRADHGKRRDSFERRPKWLFANHWRFVSPDSEALDNEALSYVKTAVCHGEPEVPWRVERLNLSRLVATSQMSFVRLLLDDGYPESIHLYETRMRLN